MICANPDCGKEFSNFVGDQIITNKKYCSKSCKNKIQSIIRNVKEKQKRHLSKKNISCIKCGSTFNTSRKDQKYCSKNCRNSSWVENNYERYNKAKIKWAKLNPDKIKLKKDKYIKSGQHKKWKNEYNNSLSDAYLKQLLKVIKKKYDDKILITKELIEEKRVLIKIKRKIKQLQNGSNSI